MGVDSLKWLEQDSDKEKIVQMAKDFNYLRSAGEKVDVISFLAHCRRSHYEIPEDLAGMMDLFRKAALAANADQNRWR